MTPLLAELKPICTAELFNELAHLPASLELVRIDYARVGADEVRRNRAVFNREVKYDFLRLVGETCAPDLAAMGVNADAVEVMRINGEYPENVRGQRLNASIDHILSLNFGGSNDFSNLVLLPARINALKDKLENLQFQKGETKGSLVTIMPRRVNGGYPHVPFIEGGFQRARLHN